MAPRAEVGYLKHTPLHSRQDGQDTLGTIGRTRRFNCKRRVKVDDNIESGTTVQLHWFFQDGVNGHQHR